MIKKTTLKYFILFLLCFGFQNETIAQCTGPNGSIRVDMYWTQAKAKAGMDDYENYDRTPGYQKPDIWYFIDYMHLRHQASYKIIGSSANRFYENQPSQTVHNINHTIMSSTVDGSGFGGPNSFNLSDINSLMIDWKITSNEEDRGFSTPINGDDDFGWYCATSWPFSNNFAWGGTSLKTRHIVCGPKEYTYSIQSRYYLDALQPHLTVKKPGGGNQDKFCRGEQYQVVASYKGPFYNGYFYWEKDHGNGVFTYFAYGVGNTITDYATNSSVRYRCRLIGDSGHYGVSNFGSCISTAKFADNYSLTVRENITGFNVEITDVCPSESLGRIRLNSIDGATTGTSYIVEFRDDFFNIETIVIDSFTNDYLTNNEISFERPVGEYYLKVTHNDITVLCGIEKTYNIKDSRSPTFTAVPTDPFCFGSQGWIDYSGIVHKNDNPPFYHTLRATNLSGEVFETSINAKDGRLYLLPGSYIAEVENTDGCIAEYTDTLTLSPKVELTATVSLQDSFERSGVFYHGSCRSDLVDVDINVNGGVPPYRIIIQAPNPANNKIFEWLEGESQKLYEAILGHGVHTIYIRDSYNCLSAPYVINVNNPATLVFPSMTGIDPTISCDEVNFDGSFVQNNSPSGGITPYTYYIDGIEVTDFNQSNIGNTSSILKLVDEQGCTVSQFLSILNSSNFSMGYEVYPDFVSCDGQPGNVQLFIDNGTPSHIDGYTILINGVPCSDLPNCSSSFNPEGLYPANGFVEFSATTPGDYFFEVSDSLGCKISRSFNVAESQMPSVTLHSAVPPACPGGAFPTTFYFKDINFENGTNPVSLNYSLDGGGLTYIPFNREGGVPGAPYLIPFEITIPITGEGAHTIEVQDAKQCGSSYSFSLEGSGVFDMTLGTVKDLICHSDTTGSIAVELDGSEPFTLELFLSGNRVDSISTISDQYMFTSLPPGDYSINATDRSGCGDSESGIIISTPSPLDGSLSSTSAINCTGINGEIEVINVTGGTAPYTYTLNEGIYQTGPILTGARLENTVTIQDSMGCYLTLMNSIPEAGPTIFPTTIESVQATDCSDGVAIIEIQPGFTFPILIQEIADPNNYTAPALFVFGDSLATEIYRDTFNNLKDTIHYFLIQDGLGCEKVDSLVITKGAPLTASVLSKTDESCHQQSKDGTINIQVLGGLAPYTIYRDTFTALTTDSTVMVTGLTTDRYSFVIEDAAGCMYNLEDSIMGGSLPEVTSIATDFTGCKGDSLLSTITVTGMNGVAPYTFLWEDGNTDNPRLNVLTKEYHVMVTDVIGCTTQETVFAPSLDSLILSVESTTDNICQVDMNGEISVNSVGGFAPLTFSVDGGNTFQTDSLLTGLGVGDHVVLVKDNHGCIDTTLATISYTNPLTASVATTNETCNLSNNGSIEVTILGGVPPFTYSLDNTNFQLQNTFTGLSADTFTVWVQDVSGCKAVYTNNIITEPTLLTLSTSIGTPETCSDVNGEVSGLAAGGTPPYSYEWNGDNTLSNNTLTNVAAGSYTLIVTDANMCTESSTVVLTDAPGPIVAIQSSQNEICGMSNGQIDLAISSGTTPFTFTWSHSGILNDSLATGLSTGTYSVTISDANMCTAVSSVSLTEIAGPTLSLQSSTNATCTNDNGNITVSPFSGTAPYSYSWSHNATLNNATASALAAGSYDVTVTDGNGCTDILNTSISFDGPPAFGTSTLVNATCNTANGSIQTTLTGGTSPFTYSWSHDLSLNAATASALSGGIYEVTVTDIVGCTSVESNLVITDLTPPSLNTSFTNNENCVIPMGEITAQTTDGLAPFTYAWSHDGSLTGPNATGLSAGSYTVTTTDSNGCTESETVILTDGAGAVLTLESSQNEICGMSNGQIDLAVSQGTPPFTFDWSHDSMLNDSIAIGLPAGSYTVTVTDVNMCSAILSTILLEIGGPDLSLQSNNNPVCTNDNGSISLGLSNGTAPFTYSWSHDLALNNSTATSLPAGNYEVTVTDGNGCSDILNTSIAFDASPVLALAISTNATCSQTNGAIQTSLSGGTAPLIYQWSHDVNLNAASASDLSSGTYSVSVTDALGCTAELNNLIISDLVPPVLSLTSFENTACNISTGIINLQTSGGLAPLIYTWSHDPALNLNTATDLDAGTYNIIVTDASGCTSGTSVEIFVTPSPELSLQSSADEICGNSNGVIDLVINNGTAPFTFDWSHNSTLNDSIAIGLSAGAYSVTVTDANMCTAILSTSLTEISGPTLSLQSSNNAACTNDNGSISVVLSNGTAPFTYSWSQDPTLNNSMATSLPAGNYEVTVTDTNGCSDIFNTNISFDAPPILAVANTIDASCEAANGSIQTTLSAGTAPFNYSWSHDPTLNAAVASQLSGGTYAVTITDALGCSSFQDNLIITDLVSPTLSVAAFNNTDCLNPMGDIEVQTAGGMAPFVYTWSHDPSVTGTNATSLSSGSYTITVTDANGCESIVTQDLIEFEGTLSITNELDCSYSSDGELLLTLQGNPADYNYEWNDVSIGDTHIAADLSTGFYSVTATNSNGCTQNFVMNFTAPQELNIDITSVTPVGCDGNLGSIVALPSGGTGNYTYLWNDATNQSTATASNLDIGTYELLLTDANGCTTIQTAEVSQATTMILTAGPVLNPSCNGDANGSVQVFVNQGEAPYTYLWNNGAITTELIDLSSGDYIVTVTDAVGCTEVLSIPLADPELLVADAVLVQEPLCNGSDEGILSVNLVGGTEPYEYSWDDDQFQTTPTATALVAGTYSVEVKDVNGCTTVDAVDLTQPTVVAISNTTIQDPSCVGSLDGAVEITATGGTPNYSYSWNGGLSTSSNDSTNIGQGNYTVQVTDANGCTISDNFAIADPNPIALVSETVTPVSCLGSPNGAINILAEGGNQDLTYTWSNGVEGTTLEDLAIGIYQVSVVDGLGCEETLNFLVSSIDSSPLELGATDTTICKNDVIFYDFSNTDYVSFNWGSLTDGDLSTEPSFTTSGEESYYVYAVRDDGCEVRDTIDVRFSAATLDAFFIAPTDVVAGDTIVALELTLPIPDSVVWDYDRDNVFLVNQINNQYLFHFPNTGEYDLIMTSFSESCSNDITKRVFVYADSTELPFFNPSLPIIVDLKLFPNPNSGFFSIDIQLSGMHDMVIDIYNDKTILIDRAIFSGEDAYTSTYEMDLPTGVYYALIQVAGVRKTLTFIVE